MPSSEFSALFQSLHPSVAHRLHTIIDSDRILVMRDGFVEELDEPHKLLMNPDSLLTLMVKNTDANAPLLFKMAKEAFDKKRKGHAGEEAEEDGETGMENNKSSVVNELESQGEKTALDVTVSLPEGGPAHSNAQTNAPDDVVAPDVAITSPDGGNDQEPVA